MDFVKFWTVCSLNGILLDEEQMVLIERYSNELLYWNKKVNLISRKDEENLLERHILHSLTPLKYISFKEKAYCLDVGTGGGLPGIPLKIARPDLKFTLIDSISKKIKMTEMFAKHTELKDIKAIAIRAEDYEKSNNNIKRFDYIFSRAVAKTDLVISWVRNIIKKDGLIVLYKGGNLDEEIEIAKRRFKDVDINVISINMNGSSWFSDEDKKLLVCKFNI
ncbi:MAG: 16S rRNA (guanine(527)-N(7))-methyltransferase RsmG [Candidatus Kapabacteria bacterium]|nr:16S rRNA (guanine(527)-N(7))-methyltransferase RsmG [Candidatus Kapabacteria bacterium]